MTANKFTDDDKIKCINFLKFVLERASWSLTTKEALELNKHLAWANSLPAKIEANVFEIKSVKTDVEPPKQSKAKK